MLYSISYYIFNMATEMVQIMVIHLNLIKLSCSVIVLLTITKTTTCFVSCYLLLVKLLKLSQFGISESKT